MASLSACEKTDRFSQLDNSIALFKSNGTNITPDLREEIHFVFNSVFTSSHLIAEYAKVQQRFEILLSQCKQGELSKQSENRKTLQELNKIKNRIIALQIIAFQNRWHIQDDLRIKKKDVGCENA